MKRLVTERVPTPAAGADWSFTPSTSDRSRLVTITALLATSATAATRMPELRIKNQEGDVVWQVGNANTVAASLQVRLNWASEQTTPYGQTLVNYAAIGLSTPGHWLEPGDVVSSFTVALQAGDAWSSIYARYLVGDEWDWRREMAEIAEQVMGDAGQ